jgi:Domain of unknown function (DUF4436)
MWKILKRGRLLLAFLFLMIYLVTLARGFTESSRRSLQLRDETVSADHIFVSVIVTNVNPARQELTAQLRFRLAGEIARDEVTPAVDLKLLINNFGQQEFDFPKGRRMNRIEASFPLNGELNKYPLDRYESNLWVLVTTPASKETSKAPRLPEATGEPSILSDELTVGTSALQQNNPIPISLALTASVPGIKFVGQTTRSEESQLMRIALKLRRADSVISVSTLVMLMMTSLSWSVLAMVVRATTSKKRANDLIPLSMSLSLIFGLPALRNVQPGVPPIGAFGDYVSFIWAELIVAVSAVITVWTWLIREHAESLATLAVPPGEDE